MRKVTAQELAHMGVKRGPNLVLPDNSKVALVKAQITSGLEKLYGGDYAVWRRVLKHAQQQPFFQRDPQKTAVQQLLGELDELEKRACLGA